MVNRRQQEPAESIPVMQCGRWQPPARPLLVVYGHTKPHWLLTSCRERVAHVFHRHHHVAILRFESSLLSLSASRLLIGKHAVRVVATTADQRIWSIDVVKHDKSLETSVGVTLVSQQHCIGVCFDIQAAIPLPSSNLFGVLSTSNSPRLLLSNLLSQQHILPTTLQSSTALFFGQNGLTMSSHCLCVSKPSTLLHTRLFAGLEYGRYAVIYALADGKILFKSLCSPETHGQIIDMQDEVVAILCGSFSNSDAIITVSVSGLVAIITSHTQAKWRRLPVHVESCALSQSTLYICSARRLLIANLDLHNVKAKDGDHSTLMLRSLNLSAIALSSLPNSNIVAALCDNGSIIMLDESVSGVTLSSSNSLSALLKSIGRVGILQKSLENEDGNLDLKLSQIEQSRRIRTAKSLHVKMMPSVIGPSSSPQLVIKYRIKNMSSCVLSSNAYCLNVLVNGAAVDIGDITDNVSCAMPSIDECAQCDVDVSIALNGMQPLQVYLFISSLASKKGSQEERRQLHTQSSSSTLLHQQTVDIISLSQLCNASKLTASTLTSKCLASTLCSKNLCSMKPTKTTSIKVDLCSLRVGDIEHGQKLTLQTMWKFILRDAHNNDQPFPSVNHQAMLLLPCGFGIATIRLSQSAECNTIIISSMEPAHLPLWRAAILARLLHLDSTLASVVDESSLSNSSKHLVDERCPQLLLSSSQHAEKIDRLTHSIQHLDTASSSSCSLSQHANDAHIVLCDVMCLYNEWRNDSSARVPL